MKKPTFLSGNSPLSQPGPRAFERKHGFGHQAVSDTRLPRTNGSSSSSEPSTKPCSCSFNVLIQSAFRDTRDSGGGCVIRGKAYSLQVSRRPRTLWPLLPKPTSALTAVANVID